MKHNKNKPKYRLVYTSLMNEIANVREKSLPKYNNDSEDWFKNKPIDHLEAGERHLRKAIDGKMIDEETKFLHLSHAAANIMFEIERIYRTTDYGKSKKRS